MPTTPSRSTGRPPLLPMPNGASGVSPRKRSTKNPPVKQSARPPRPTVRASLGPGVNPSKGANPGGARKARAASKRVSFGGENINVYNPNPSPGESNSDSASPTPASAGGLAEAPPNKLQRATSAVGTRTQRAGGEAAVRPPRHPRSSPIPKQRRPLSSDDDDDDDDNDDDDGEVNRAVAEARRNAERNSAANNSSTISSAAVLSSGSGLNDNFSRRDSLASLPIVNPINATTTTTSSTAKAANSANASRKSASARLSSAADPRRSSTGLRRASDARRKSLGLFLDEMVETGREIPTGEDENDVTMHHGGGMQSRARRDSTYSQGSDSDITRNVASTAALVDDDEGPDMMDISPVADETEGYGKQTTLDGRNEEEEEDTREALPEVRHGRISLAPVGGAVSIVRPVAKTHDVVSDLRVPRMSLPSAAQAGIGKPTLTTLTSLSNDSDDAAGSPPIMEDDGPSPDAEKDRGSDDGSSVGEEAVADLSTSRLSLAPVITDVQKDSNKKSHTGHVQNSANTEISSEKPPKAPAWPQDVAAFKDLQRPGTTESFVSLAPVGRGQNEPRETARQEDDEQDARDTAISRVINPPDLDESPALDLFDEGDDVTLRNVSSVAMAAEARPRRTSMSGAMELLQMLEEDEESGAVVSERVEAPMAQPVKPAPRQSVEPSHIRNLFENHDPEDETLHDHEFAHSRASVGAVAGTGREPGSRMKQSALPLVTSPPRTARISAPEAGRPTTLETTKPRQAEVAPEQRKTETPSRTRLKSSDTPKSATKRKMQQITEERSSTKQRRSAYNYHHADNVDISRETAVALVETEATNEDAPGVPKHSLSDFQAACKELGLDFRAEHTNNLERERDVSMVPTPSTQRVNRSTIAGLMYEKALEETVLNLLNEEIAKMEESLQQSRADIEQAEASLEHTCPAEFVKVCQQKGRAEFNRFSINLKRLYKISSLQAKLEWVTGRNEWEKDMTAGLESEMRKMEEDMRTLEKMERDLRVMLREMPEADEQSSAEDAVVLRRNYVHELSLLRDTRALMGTLDSDEKELEAKEQRLGEKKAEHEAKREKLGMFARADTFDKLKKLSVEKTELVNVASFLTGVKLNSVKKNACVIRANDLVDLNFSIHQDRVINVSCSAVQYGGCSDAWQSYLDAVVRMVGVDVRVRDVKFLCDVSYALYGTSGVLMRAKAAFCDAAHYLSNNLGTMLECGAGAAAAGAGGQKAYVEVKAQAAFYSMEPLCKFDVVASVRTFSELVTHGTPMQQVEVESITRVFGAAPSDEEIREAMLSARGTRVDCVKLSEAFGNVWNLLSV